MARSRLRGRRRRRARLIAVAVLIGLVVAVPVAQAGMAVFDELNFAKAIEQIKEAKASVAAELKQLEELKQSVSFLSEISTFMNETKRAIGEVTNITLPIPNIEKMRAQMKSDLRCLMPGGMKWGIKFEDLNLASICETSSKYREALFINQDKLKNMPFNEQNAARHLANARRSALLEDTAIRSLSMGDVQIQQAGELTKAADDLQGNLDSASTVQDRAHVGDQVQILQARAAAQQNLILAQMLRLQAAQAVKAGLPADTVADITGEGEGK